MRHESLDTGRAAPLPILVFDERRLTPSFGYVFHRKWVDPEESIVSILWKFARMNGLAGHMVATQIAKQTIDPYEGIEARRDLVDVRRLRQTLKLPLKVLRAALIPAPLYRIASPWFRFCPRCLRRGYHGVLHQLDTLHHCPMHGDWLQTDCRWCGQPTPFRLNARLLDAPFRCGMCRSYYVSSCPAFVNRKPFSVPAMVSLTRTRLRFRV